MSDQKVEKAPRGVALEFKDQTALIEQVLGNSTPEAAIREIVKNSMEGNRRQMKREGRGATKVDILPGRGLRSSIIRDNGPGMDEQVLEASMGALGAGLKERGRQKNQGIGAKLIGAAWNPDGVIITSWVNRTTAYQIVLKVQHDPERETKAVTWLPGPDGKAIRRVNIPKDATTQSGTQVELMNYPFKPFIILKYLNSRFRNFITPDAPDGVNVRVHRAAGVDGPYEDRALGYEKCLERIARAGDFGHVEAEDSYGEKVRFLWCIKDSSAEREKTIARFCEDYFPAPCLGLEFQGEMYERTSSGRAATVLTGYGIRAGGRDIILFPEVSGPKVTPDLTRTNLGSSIDRDELKESIRENLPQRILDYMDDFESEHFEEHTDSVAEHLVRLYATAAYLSPASDSVITPQSITRPSGEDERSGNESGNRERGKKRGRRKNASRGWPRTVFVDSAQLGSLLVHYDEVNHVIQINKDHPRIKRVLAGIKDAPKGFSKSWLESEAMGHIKAQASAAFNNLAQERGVEPSDDDLESNLGVCPGATLFLSNPGKFKLAKNKKG